jgi:hypothetical protein
MLDLVYKYRTYNARALEILINKELWLAEPKSLNDPFDCQREYSEIIDNAFEPLKLSEKKRTAIAKATAKVVGNLRVLSLSTEDDNPLLWAHYADSHKGFCLGFRKNIFDSPYSENKVRYKNEAPKLVLSNELIETSNFECEEWHSKLTAELHEYLYKFACTKPKQWKYEVESRIITLDPIQGKVVKFFPSFLDRVYFGLNMCIKDQKSVRELLSSKEWSHVSFFKMKKIAGSFKLKPEKISSP